MADTVAGLNTRVAVVGNHDFDLGLDQLLKLVALTPNTKWLLSNVYDIRDNKILGGFYESVIITHCGIRLGFIGIVEPEWIATLSMDTHNIICKDPAEVATRLAQELKAEGADVVIALTHMRMPNDVLLAQNAKGLDLILGGHDHEVYYEFVNGIHVAKSGTEFRYASIVTITKEDGAKDGKCNIDYQIVPVTRDIPEDPAILEIRERYGRDMEEKMKKPVGYVTHDMDARASYVRNYESDIGNLLTDIMRNEVEADFALLNSGTIRTDAIIPKGYFTMKDLFNLLPFEDLTCKTEVSGATMRKALEAGVSLWPKHEGRFPQVSGLSFTFDPNREPGNRVLQVTTSHGLPLEDNKTYTLACKPYISLSGKDGYDVFLGSKLLTPLEQCLVNSVSFANYLRRLSIIQQWKYALEHPQQTDALPKIRHAISSSQLTADDGQSHLSLGNHWAKASIGPPHDPRLIHFKDLVKGVLDELPPKLAIIDPAIEGRIKMVPLQEKN